jgi:hypothetical protein
MQRNFHVGKIVKGVLGGLLCNIALLNNSKNSL